MSHLRCSLAVPFLPTRRLDGRHDVCLLPSLAPCHMPNPAVPASSQHGSSGNRRSNNVWPDGMFTADHVLDSFRLSSYHVLFVVVLEPLSRDGGVWLPIVHNTFVCLHLNFVQCNNDDGWKMHSFTWNIETLRDHFNCFSLSTTAFQNLTKGDKKRQTYSYLCLMFVWDFSKYRIWERGRFFICNTFFWGSLAFQLVCFRLPHMSQTPEGSVSMHLCDPQTFCSTILVPQLLPASALDIHIWPSNWSVHQL